MDRLRSLARASLPFLALTAIACGGGGSGPTVTGTIGGKAFAPVEAISSPVSLDYTPAGAILIGTQPGLCEMFAAKTVPKNETLLSILVGHVDDTGKTAGSAPTEPGTFVIPENPDSTNPPTDVAQAQYVETDDTCTIQKGLEVTSGSITLDSVEGGAYAGEAELVMSSGEKITVSFNATKCDALNAVYDSSWDPKCK